MSLGSDRRVAAEDGRQAVDRPSGVRQQELAQLAAELAAARTGDGRSVLLTGSPGIGKSWVVAAICRSARQRGTEVWSATGSPAEQLVPFGLLRALAGPAVHRDGDRLLAGRARRAGRLLQLPAGGEAPGWPIEGGRTGEPVSQEAPPLDLATLDALYWLVVNAAECRPLLLAVDDLHWADAASVRFLSYLARRLAGLRLLLLVAGRRRELDRLPLGGTLGPGTTTEVHLPPLRPEETAVLLAELFHRPPDPAFSASCHRLARGSPLVLVELARSALAAGLTPTAGGLGGVEAAGTEAVGRTVALRLAEVDAYALRLAEAGAVLGDRSPLAWAVELAGLDEREATAAVDQLRKIEILASLSADTPTAGSGPAGPQVRFVHPLVAASLRDRVDPWTLAHWHERAAELLATREAPDPAVAEHLLVVAPTGSARWVEVLRRAARATLDGGDGHRAAAFAHRALAEAVPAGITAPGARAELLSLAAGAEERFDVLAAARHYEEAAELTDDPVSRARRLMQAAARYPSDRPEEAIRLGNAAVAILGDVDPELYRTSVAVVSTTRCLLTPGDPDPLLAAAGRPGRPGRVADPGAGDGPSTRMLVAVETFRAAWDGSSTSAQARALAEPVFHGDWTGTLDVTSGPLVLAVLVLVAADSPVVPRVVDQWLAKGRSQGSLAQTGGALWLRAHLALARGDLSDAATDAEDGAEALVGGGVGGAALAAAAADWAGVLLEQGQIDRAGQVLAQAEVTAGDPGLPGRGRLMLCRARWRAASNPRAALEETLHVGDRYERLGGRNPALLPWRSQAAAIVALPGLREDPELRAMAVDLAGTEVEGAARWGAPTALAQALAAAADVQPDPDLAVALAGRAVAVASGSPAAEAGGAARGGGGDVGRGGGEGAPRAAGAGLGPGVATPGLLTVARARAALGRAQLEAGSTAVARDSLRLALDLADHCGAAGLARRARSDLVAAGARPRRRRLTGPGALTPNERRTAELVAGGASNREVAETLFLTVGAVEAQLTSVYRKLGIRSRSQLASTLDERPSRPRRPDGAAGTPAM